LLWSRWKRCGSEPDLRSAPLDPGRDLAGPGRVAGRDREVEVLVAELQTGRPEGGVGGADRDQAVEADLHAVPPVAHASRGADPHVGHVSPGEAQGRSLERRGPDHQAGAHGPVRCPGATEYLDGRVGDDDQEQHAEAAGQQDEGARHRRRRQGHAKDDEREPRVAQVSLEGFEHELRLRLHARIVGFVPQNQAAMTDDPDRNFREAVRLSRLVDPMPTLQALARNTGLELDDVVHHALVRYASDGAETLLSIEPRSLRELIAARRAGDWKKVGSIIDWLQSGLTSAHWR
jgi:hypothetical protein